MKESNQVFRQFFAMYKGLMHPGRKPAMEKLIANIESIRKLIDTDLIAINSVRPYVVISAPLHTYYINDDGKYANFLYNVLSYINIERGRLSIKKAIMPEDRLDFSVVQSTTRFVPQEGETWENMPIDSIETLLVGVYQNGVVYYQSYP